MQASSGDSHPGIPRYAKAPITQSKIQNPRYPFNQTAFPRARSCQTSMGLKMFSYTCLYFVNRARDLEARRNRITMLNFVGSFCRRSTVPGDPLRVLTL